MIYYFVCLLFLLCSCDIATPSKKDYSCIGEIISKDYISYIKISKEKNKECYVLSRLKPYYIKKSDSLIYVKISPPTRKILSDSDEKIIMPKVLVIKNIGPLETDTIDIPWVGLQKDTILLNNDVKIAPLTQFYFTKDALYEPFTTIKKGQSLIIDIPCLDEETAKNAPPFHIAKTKYPTIRCKIAPVDRDYFGE